MLDLRDLRDLPSRLDQDEKDVIQLIVFHDLTTDEAAEVLEIPEGTVKSRLSKAKKQLLPMIKRLLPESQR